MNMSHIEAYNVALSEANKLCRVSFMYEYIEEKTEDDTIIYAKSMNDRGNIEVCRGIALNEFFNLLVSVLANRIHEIKPNKLSVN